MMYNPGDMPKGQFVYSKAQRDRAILLAMRAGHTNTRIARDLGLSPGTVRNYVSEILAELGAATRTEAVVTAMERGMIPSPRAIR